MRKKCNPSNKISRHRIKNFALSDYYLFSLKEKLIFSLFAMALEFID